MAELQAFSSKYVNNTVDQRKDAKTTVPSPVRLYCQNDQTCWLMALAMPRATCDVSTDLLPSKEIKRLLTAIDIIHLEYEKPLGEKLLREAVADHLRKTEGLRL